MMPGRNMKSARAWKLFRLAFKLRVGDRLSAASKRFAATLENPFPSPGDGGTTVVSVAKAGSTGIPALFIL